MNDEPEQDDEMIDSLRWLEESLWREDSRYDPDYMDAILAPGFVEFGRSGRVWAKANGVPMGSGPIGRRCHSRHSR